MLSLSQAELAERAKVAKQTLADFERGARTPYPRTLADIRASLEEAGVQFIEPNGVLLTKEQHDALRRDANG